LGEAQEIEKEMLKKGSVKWQKKEE
jgi:hypothetical protein